MYVNSVKKPYKIKHLWLISWFLW